MPETVGARLKRLREERGWTQYEVAKRAHMIPWAIARLERKTTLGNVQAHTLKRLAQVFGVTADYLMREPHDEGRKPATLAGVDA